MSSTPSRALSTEPAPLPIAWVERLFTSLAAAFGNRLADLFAGQALDEVKSQWGAALAGFAPEELKRGIDECGTRIWPPNLGEFCRMCRPCLDPERAWHEAVDGLVARDRGELGEWSHPAVFRAACAMSPELRGAPYKQHAARWGHVLARELRAGWGEPVPAPAPRLTAARPQGHGEIPEDVRARIATLTQPEPAQRADPLAWARRIVARRKAGLKVAAGTLRIAQEALEKSGARA